MPSLPLGARGAIPLGSAMEKPSCDSALTFIEDSMPSVNNPRITIAEAAQLKGVHPQTIRRMIARGELVGYRFGPRLLRVDPAELEALEHPIPTAGTVAAR